MLNVAVCDHSLKTIEFIEDLLIDRLGFNHVEITYFYNGNTLLQSVRQGDFYDLIFLEIDLNKENGIETGKELRKINMSHETLLIFTAGSTDHIIDAFDAHPYYIMAKPIDEITFINCINKALQMIAKRNRVCQFHKGWTAIRYPLDSIIWFETGTPHYINIVTNHNTDQVKEKLSDVEKMLLEMNAINFVRPHRSYIINMDYIVKYNMQFIQMRDHHETIQISEKYKEHTRVALSQYLSERSLYNR